MAASTETASSRSTAVARCGVSGVGLDVEPALARADDEAAITANAAIRIHRMRMPDSPVARGYSL